MQEIKGEATTKMKMYKTLILTGLAVVLCVLAMAERAAAFDCDQTQNVYCQLVASVCQSDCNGDYPCTCYCDNDFYDCLDGAGCDHAPITDSCD